MSGILIHTGGSGGGFHDLDRNPSPVVAATSSSSSASSPSYRDHVVLVAGTEDSIVFTPTAGIDGYRDDPRQRGYHDYNDDDDDDDEDGSAPSHSLPHVDDVRMRAMSIVNQNPSGRASSGVVVPASILICLTNLCTTKSGWLCMAFLGLILIISLSVGLHNRSNNDNGNSSNVGGFKDPNAFPYDGFTFASDREKQIVRYLLDVSTVQALNDTRSAQRRAAQWMALNDTLQYAVPTLGQVNVQAESIPFLQRYAIVTLYYSLQGPVWTRRGKTLGFLTPTLHECNWNRPIAGTAPAGTELSSSSDDDIDTATATGAANWASSSVLGVACDKNLVVNSIYLDGVNSKKHSAYLTPELGNLLPGLRLLNLDNNNLYGPLPTSMSQLSTLVSLSLTHNNLKGSFPLKALPLSQLRYLDLSNSMLSGVIPEQDYFPRLKFLYLSKNSLTGSLPQGMASWTNLQILAMDRNQLQGPLPPTLAPMWKLEQVYLEENYFSGSLDGMFADAEGNTLQKRLQIFDVSNNKLGGTIPAQIFRVPTLKILDLHHNNFEGKLPNLITDSRIGDERALQYISVKFTRLSGSIPFTWGNLHNLTHLDLSLTHMTGVIPITFKALHQLQFLYLTNYNLKNRNLNSNKYDKTFPNALSSLTTLRELGLHNTGITGTIPNWIGTFTSLRSLALDRNSLRGTIPTEMGNLVALRILLLENNNLQGTIPTEFGKLTKLKALLVEANAGINGTVANTSAICTKGLDVFISDCGDTNKPQIVCECCSSCCKDAYDRNCVNQDFIAIDYDNWRKGYNTVVEYQFGDQNVSTSV